MQYRKRVTTRRPCQRHVDGDLEITISLESDFAGVSSTALGHCDLPRDDRPPSPVRNLDVFPRCGAAGRSPVRIANSHAGDDPKPVADSVQTPAPSRVKIGSSGGLIPRYWPNYCRIRNGWVSDGPDGFEPRSERSSSPLRIRQRSIPHRSPSLAGSMGPDGTGLRGRCYLRIVVDHGYRWGR